MSLTLAENVIVAGADNRPPMLDKTNYSSWASRMLLYIKGKEHGKLLVDSVLNGPFQYRTIVEPGNENSPTTVRARTYTDLTDEENLRESIDIKATNIFLQVVHQQSYQAHALQQIYQAPVVQQPLQPSSTKLDLGLAIPSFNPSDDLIANLNKLMAFVTSTFSPYFPQTNNQLRTSSNPRNQATIQDGRVTVQTVQGRQSQGNANNGARNNATNQRCTKLKRPKNSAWFKEKMLQKEALELGAYLDLEQLAFPADNMDTIIPAQASQEIPTPAAF
ncbi:hypothetical protein Tco_1087263 [Tanacetum coccineum]